MLFETLAWAQSAAVAQPQTFFDQLLVNPVVPIVLIFGVMYFLFIRPQSKKASDHQKMLSALKRNDEVVTTGGLIGRIAELSEKLVTLEIAPNVRVRVERNQIAAISSYGRMPRREKGEQSKE
jgi:preprotein translocase subunit YajC